MVILGPDKVKIYVEFHPDFSDVYNIQALPSFQNNFGHLFKQHLILIVS